MKRSITAMIVAVVLLAMTVAPVPEARAEVIQEADGSVTVGVQSEILNDVFKPQRKTQWCWAACIEMLLAHNGVTVSQESIVRRSYGMNPYGQLPNWPGSFETITRNLNYRGRDATGREHAVSATVLPGAPTPAVLIQELAANQPVIIGYHTGQSGHAVLITAANYVQTPQGPMIRSLTVRDPFPYPNAPDNGKLERPGAVLANRVMAHWFVRVEGGEAPQAADEMPNVQTQGQAYQMQWDNHQAAVTIIPVAEDGKAMAKVAVYQDDHLVASLQGEAAQQDGTWRVSATPQSATGVEAGQWEEARINFDRHDANITLTDDSAIEARVQQTNANNDPVARSWTDRRQIPHNLRDGRPGPRILPPNGRQVRQVHAQQITMLQHQLNALRARAQFMQQQSQRAAGATQQHDQAARQQQVVAQRQRALARQAQVMYQRTGNPQYAMRARQHAAAAQRANLTAQQHAARVRLAQRQVQQLSAALQRIQAAIAQLQRQIAQLQQ